MVDLRNRSDFFYKINLPFSFYREPLTLHFKFNGETMKQVRVNKPGDHLIHIKIPDKFRKPGDMSVEANESRQISLSDARKAAYLFVSGSFKEG